ncbi:MAG: Smr/MutS family protein, partial [Clostridia bacterium]|nr:Smr/MutS family protein [Clostridia bacterium]
KIKNLRLVEGSTVTFGGAPKPQQRTSERKIVSEAVTEVDVRGLNVDEASIEIDKVIDSAVLRNLGELRIIHGKGTGALRAGLHQHFRRHPNIKSFRLGVYGEGEAGVTIIELK